MEEILKKTSTSELVPTEALDITETVGGVVTRDYLTKSGVYAGSVIDEIVDIDVTLADVFSFVSNKRKFAFFGEVVSGEDIKELDKTNINDYMQLLTEENTKKILNVWFNSGGTAITIINFLTLEENKVVEFEAKNIITAGILTADQLKAYELYKLADKRIFLTKNKNDDFGIVAKSRNVAVFLVGGGGIVEEDLPIFEYYAKYTVNYYYNKNNFANSKKFTGLKLDSISYLLVNNIGSLMVLDNNSPSIYYNMVDYGGYDINLGFLKDDIVDKIQMNIINCLKVNNTYNQSSINRIDSAIKKAALFFVDLKRIGDFKQSLIPFNKQEQEDIKNGIVRGFVLKYQALTEIKQTKINLVEVIGEFEEEI